MKFSKKGAVLGFVSGVTGGSVAGFTDYTFPVGVILAVLAAFIVALMVNIVWEWRS